MYVCTGAGRKWKGYVCNNEGLIHLKFDFRWDLSGNAAPDKADFFQLLSWLAP